MASVTGTAAEVASVTCTAGFGGGNETAARQPRARSPRGVAAADEGDRSTPNASAADVSVVVPAWRDTDAVRRLLDGAACWVPAPHEVLVVSGEPDTALAQLCREHGARYLEGPANRGAQLALGADAARGDVLWFLHADASPPPNGIAAIRLALASGAESGAFRFVLDGCRTWYKSALEHGVALRLRLGGIAYGDQALFATRHAYRAAGGFAAVPLFEEVRLVRSLKRRGTFRVLPEPVRVATRRWERDGWIARTLCNRWLAFRHALGARPEGLAAAYHKRSRREEPPEA